MMKCKWVMMLFILLTGCATNPYSNYDLDTTSDFQSPSEGKAGIYVYQWKSGIVGAIWDVDFEIKGFPKMALNTGEYGYFEIPPGEYEFRMWGLFNLYQSMKFEADKNYFFRAYLSSGLDHITLVTYQREIDDAKLFISSGRYEEYSVD